MTVHHLDFFSSESTQSYALLSLNTILLSHSDNNCFPIVSIPFQFHNLSTAFQSWWKACLPEATNGRHFLLHDSLSTPPSIASCLFQHHSLTHAQLVAHLWCHPQRASGYSSCHKFSPPSLPSHPLLPRLDPHCIPLKLLSWDKALLLLLHQSHCRPWDDSCSCIPHFPACQSNLRPLCAPARPAPTLRLPHSCSSPRSGPPGRFSLLLPALHTPAQI